MYMYMYYLMYNLLFYEAIAIRSHLNA